MPHQSCSSNSAIRVSNLDLTDRGQPFHRTAPTKDQVLVPETLLKKRKSQEKAREQRSAEIEKRKKVCHIHNQYDSMFCDDTYHYCD